jgi:hypothetical protein
LENVLVQDGSELFDSYHTTVTPSVVIVATDGRIANRTQSTRANARAAVRP